MVLCVLTAHSFLLLGGIIVDIPQFVLSLHPLKEILVLTAFGFHK